MSNIIGFIFKPAEDDSVDAEWVLTANRDISIQDCKSYLGVYVVNVWHDAEGAMEEVFQSISLRDCAEAARQYAEQHP